ncbi:MULTISPECIES: hypothetical protein [unclassified Paenibacillus]|jgi:hypothetical protein|uniref:hypothetical protein n=1 Tax=unclassified Paenibacillus TaxID=185978 RepID=UPI0030F4F8F4
MSSLIYIAVVIVIAIFSNMNKAGKNKQKNAPRGGMPTFGGGGDASPLRRARQQERNPEEESPARQGSGFPVPGESSYPGQPSVSYEEREYDSSPVWKESPERPSPDYDTGEGMSLEQSGEDSVQARTERMQRELERLQASFDGMAGASEAGDAGTASKSGAVSARSAARHGLADNRESLRNGLVWAEILAPPRSRKPHSSRR